MGKIVSFFLPRLAASEMASSTALFSRYLLCPTIWLHHTPKYYSVWYVRYTNTPPQPGFHPILVQRHQGPSLTTNNKNGLSPISLDHVIPNYIKRLPVPNWFLYRQHYVGNLSSPATFVTGQTIQTLCFSLPLYLTPTDLTLHVPKNFCRVSPSSRSYATLITL